NKPGISIHTGPTKFFTYQIYLIKVQFLNQCKDGLMFPGSHIAEFTHITQNKNPLIGIHRPESSNCTFHTCRIGIVCIEINFMSLPYYNLGPVVPGNIFGQSLAQLFHIYSKIKSNSDGMEKIEHIVMSPQNRMDEGGFSLGIFDFQLNIGG